MFLAPAAAAAAREREKKKIKKRERANGERNGTIKLSKQRRRG